MTTPSKADVRTAVWTELREKRAARFPFPVTGRIPNFDGAKAAAQTLLDHPIFEGVRSIKCNPDSPQKYVRQFALERGITVYIPTPRLKGGFMRLDPAVIDPEDYVDASMLSRMEPHTEPVSLEDLPGVDLIVTGCVAVTRGGKRAGKGEGYSDLEAAILCELGHDPVPIVTTVHDLQVVNDFPTDPHDISLSLIVTPTSVIDTGAEVRRRTISWDALTDHDLEEMPILADLRDVVSTPKS